jgi:hypothetical protein
MTDIRVVHVGMKFVGVDVAKRVLVACALGEDRVIVVDDIFKYRNAYIRLMIL